MPPAACSAAECRDLQITLNKQIAVIAFASDVTPQGSTMKSRQSLLSAALAALIIAPLSWSTGRAQTIIDDWSAAKFPAPPQLKPAKIEAKETALLVMDFTTQTCTVQRRPRCAASVPKVEKLITESRAKGALVIYSIAGTGATAASILKELAPAAGETVLPALGPDKFIGSDLEKTLKDKGIKTVIAVGTQAQTSVLHTAAAAALRGFKVVVPVDGMSSDDVFPELYTAWHLATAARISDQVTLTKVDMIGY
jgi:nicotinamidase-related amidase